MKHISNRRLAGEGGLRSLMPRLCSWVGSGRSKACLPEAGAQHPTSTRFLRLRQAVASDVESGEGLHQGDLLAGLRFAPVVLVAAPALEGFEPVPLLLPLLLLQALLLPALLVGDLEERRWVSRLRKEVGADRAKSTAAFQQDGTKKTHLPDQTRWGFHYCSNFHVNVYPLAELANKPVPFSSYTDQSDLRNIHPAPTETTLQQATGRLPLPPNAQGTRTNAAG